MSMTLGIKMCARYDPIARVWCVHILQSWGDECFKDLVGFGRSADEARGQLLRKLIQAGMDQDAVYLSMMEDET